MQQDQISPLFNLTHLLRRQMSTETESIVDRLKSSGLWRTKGLIGGKWIDAYDGKTSEDGESAAIKERCRLKKIQEWQAASGETTLPTRWQLSAPNDTVSSIPVFGAERSLSMQTGKFLVHVDRLTVQKRVSHIASVFPRFCIINTSVIGYSISDFNQRLQSFRNIRPPRYLD
ncbi:unnamed protein product [Lactuca saligna]|uniref:Uncharacterized protein n=1 Tax=Lactuca saligna TaxID=75948 RepID=A0AA35ZN74_LACSI|nr:unnamed protein product [Lactuca saligna]